jgi:ribosomal protein S18 acetylase RimI-like enzyme
VTKSREPDYSETRQGKIRPVSLDDMPGLRAVIAATQLFPAELLDSMIASYFAGDASDDLWLTVDEDGPIAVAYCAPERMTHGTWNLYLLAVHPDGQRRGSGSALVRSIRAELAARRQRVLIVETSGLPEFEHVRAFYSRTGFDEEARIREFYQVGEDKVIFRMALLSDSCLLSSRGQ